VLALYRHMRARGVGGSINEVVDQVKQVNRRESVCDANMSVDGFGVTYAARCGTTTSASLVQSKDRF
jgi:hypothetical protein